MDRMRSTSFGVTAWAVSLAAALGGCSAAGSGAGNLASLSTPASPGPLAPAPVVYGAFLDGPAGTRLPEPDRTAALAAEDGALSSGERRTWKGQKGVYGFVVPGPAGASAATTVADGGPAAECRSFTHTIYFAGRPQTGKGTGCRDADGSWHVTS